MANERTKPATATTEERAVTMHGELPLRSDRSGAQARSRVLGRDEHNVMLALGLVRAAQTRLAAIEGKLQRACELILGAGTPRAALHVQELTRLLDELSREVREAVFDGQPLLRGSSSVYVVDAAAHGGEPLRVDLPELEAALFGERGLCQAARITAARSDAEQATRAARACLDRGRQGLERAERELAVLLAHFHRQRTQHDAPADERALPRIAEGLRRRVLGAGRSALAAQGELSARTLSLVLDAAPKP